MVALKALVDDINEQLNIHAIKDYCPNGLQVSGNREIKQLVTGVTANQALLQAAMDRKADAVLVHHGIFWHGDNPCVVGPLHGRLRSLLVNDCALLAYHLPLDAHRKLGNNIKLAEKLGFIIDEIHPVSPGHLPILYAGHLPHAMPIDALSAHVTDVLKREPLVVIANDRPVKRIAWCSGAAQDYLPDAAALGVDAYLSGEISERTAAQAKEYGVSYIAAGHHATERYGVQALGAYLADKYALIHCFIDIDNPA